MSVPDTRVRGTVVKRAVSTLIYVPGLGHDAINSADVIAKSIAERAGAHRPDSVQTAEKTPAASPGLRAVRTLIDSSGQRLLDITELDYREGLEGLARDDGREGTPPGLVVQTYYAFRAAKLCFSARKRPGKSGTAKLQLGLGTAAMVLLTLALVVTGLGFVSSALLGVGLELPGWTTDAAPWTALTGGIVSAAALMKWRGNILRAARRVRQLLRYFDEPSDRVKITDVLDAAVGKLRDTGYAGDVHVLAYSFGSIVALDTYTASVTSPSITEGTRGTTSIVTVGCPYDFVKLYLPGHFADRKPLRAEIAWHNVFIASDVFGSNFSSVDDIRQESATLFENWTVTNHRYLDREILTVPKVVFRWIGLRRHNIYWYDDGVNSGGCWNATLLRLWGLLPPGPP